MEEGPKAPGAAQTAETGRIVKIYFKTCFLTGHMVLYNSMPHNEVLKCCMSADTGIGE